MQVFHGDSKDIGRQLGSYYKAKNIKIAKPVINENLIKSQIKAYELYYPGKLEQLEVTAIAAGFNIKDFIYKNLCINIDRHDLDYEPQKGCTIFGVENNYGVFVGRNYDWAPGTEKYFDIFKCDNKFTHSYIGISDMDYTSYEEAKRHHFVYCVDDAINDKGLYIGLTFAYNKNSNTGILPNHMIQYVSETCSTVDDVIDLFNKVPLAIPKNFFIADSAGKMAVIEHTSKIFKVLKPNNGILVQTNHYIDPNLATEDTVHVKNPNSTTFDRYNNALKALSSEQKEINQDSVFNILNDPAKGVLSNELNFKTIWSLSMNMKNRNYRLLWNFFENVKEEKLNF